jgi:hypothetical protein
MNILLLLFSFRNIFVITFVVVLISVPLAKLFNFDLNWLRCEIIRLVLAHLESIGLGNLTILRCKEIFVKRCCKVYLSV